MNDQERIKACAHAEPTIVSDDGAIYEVCEACRGKRWLRPDDQWTVWEPLGHLVKAIPPPLRTTRERKPAAVVATSCRYHPDRRVLAKGLCTACYERARREALGKKPRPGRRARLDRFNCPGD